MNRAQRLLEMATISRIGAKVYADTSLLRDATEDQVFGNIVICHNKTANMMLPAGWTYIWFMDSDEAAEKVKSGEYGYLLFPKKTMQNLFDADPINDIWKKNKRIEGSEHVLGAIEAYVNSERALISLLSVRKPFQKNTIGARMVTALQKCFKGRKLLYDDLTPAGATFVGKTADTFGIENINPTGKTPSGNQPVGSKSKAA